MSASGAGAIPGYATPEAEALARGVRPVTLVTAQLALTAAVLVAAARELCSRAPQLVLGPLESPTDGVVATGIVGLAAGAAAGFAAGRRAWGAPLLLLLSSLVSTLAPLLWCAAFAAQERLAVLAPALTGLSAGALAAAAFAVARSLGPHAAALGMVPHLLAPFRLGTAALATALTLGASANLPLCHAGAALGALLALLAASAAALHHYLLRERLQPWLRWAMPMFALALSVVALAHAEWRLPLGEARGYPGEVLLVEGGERQRVAIVSERSHFELYLDRTLKLSGVDAQRYAEALVEPAMLAARQRSSVLLLGGGTGLVERELLRFKDVQRLTVVATDGNLPAIARRSPWLARASSSALDDARVELVEAEPIVWLAATERRYDVIVSDVEDPVGYRQAKHFTRRFYELVAAHLSEGGTYVVQAPSPLTFARAFASVSATLGATGMSIAPYHAALPALGDWGFFLVSGQKGEPGLRDRVVAATGHLPQGLVYVSGATLPGLFHFPRDLAVVSGAVNTLPSQPIVELYAESNAHRAD